MRATVESKSFKISLAKMAGIPGHSTGLPGNSIICIDADEFGGVRLQRTTSVAHALITCAGEVSEGGKIYVPFFALFNALGVCDGDKIELFLKDGLNIASDSGAAVIESWKDDDFIPPPDTLEGRMLKLAPQEFIETLKICQAAAATDRARPSLMGVGIRKKGNSLLFIGCNGHRIHCCRIASTIENILTGQNGKDIGMLLPNEGVAFLLKMFADNELEACLTISADAMQVDAGDMSVRLPASSDPMPHAEELLQTNKDKDVTISVQREALLRAAKAVDPASDGEGISLTVSKKSIIVTAKSSGAKVERLIHCDCSGSGKYRIDGRYLISMLEACREPIITIYTTQERAFFCQEGERDFMVLCRISAADK